jgi:hypothetical protein
MDSYRAFRQSAILPLNAHRRFAFHWGLVASAVLFGAQLSNEVAHADSCPNPSFMDARTFGVGGYPGFVAVGDFNRDGKLDIVVANHGAFDNSGTLTNVGVTVLLGSGDGSFCTGVHYAAEYPQSLAVGDLDGDGKLDLVLAMPGSWDQRAGTYTNSRVSILLGKGDGSFKTAVDYEAGQFPGLVSIGDFNGDSKPDLAVANLGAFDEGSNTYTNSSVSVLLGNGDGTFRIATNFANGSYPQTLVLGDFNGDGKPDLAVQTDAGVSILLGRGDGSFNAAFTYDDANVLPSSLAVGDFNGDGKPDLVLASPTNNGGISISVLLGKGDGTFEAPINTVDGLDTLGELAGVAVGDLNGDGKPDLAVVGAGGGVRVLLGKGNGTFQLPIHYAAGSYSASVAMGDFNGDGNPDLVAATSGIKSHSPGVSVLLNNGDGGFQAAINYTAGAVNCCSDPGPVSVAVGDFNGDGKPDLAVANVGEGHTNGTISVLLGNGDGTFQRAVTYNTGNVPLSVTVSDFNGDGKPDLAVLADPYYGDSHNLCILLGKGDGTFEPAVKYEGPPNGPVCVADFNGDGKPDLVASDDFNSAVSVLFGKGDGSFQITDYNTGVDWPQSVAVGDFNGDSKPDIAVVGRDETGTNSNVALLLGNGDGTFEVATRSSTGVSFSPVTGVGDFNGDGKLDFAVAKAGVSSNTVSIFLGNGDGTFQSTIVSFLPFNSDSLGLVVGDFNGDGNLDLVLSEHDFYGTVWVLLGNGDGTFLPAAKFAAALECYSLAAGDFNGDGKPDLAVANEFGVLVLLNTCASAGIQLSILRTGSVYTLSWPYPSVGFVLETSTTLDPPNWQPTAEVPVNNNGHLALSVPISTRERYFRLRK